MSHRGKEYIFYVLGREDQVFGRRQKMKKRMVNTGNNSATGSGKLNLKRQTLSKLIGGDLRRLYFKLDPKFGKGPFAKMGQYKNLVPINPLSNADFGAGCTDTGRLSNQISCWQTGC